MSFAKITAALNSSYVSGSFSLTTSWPGVAFTPPVNTAWAQVNIVPSEPEIVSLGNIGRDRYRGFLQVSLMYPQGSGNGLLIEKYEALRTYYTAGRKFTYQGQVVHITRCALNGPYKFENLQRGDVSIYWWADVARTTQ